MKPFYVFATFLRIFVNLPIWFYLVYTLLAAIHPDRLIWFLFWTYVPVGFFIAIVCAASEVAEKKAAAKQK